jgi:uncharacterized DUF497 family protein
MGKPWYTGNMRVAIEFNPAAFKHGVNEADIRMAFDTARYDAFLEENDEDARDRYLLIGFDRNANLIEVLYNVIDDDTINVFHAMPCTNMYLHLIRPEE